MNCIIYANQNGDGNYSSTLLSETVKESRQYIKIISSGNMNQTNDLEISDTVIIKRRRPFRSYIPSKESLFELRGVIAYLGPVHFADGDDWVGVRLIGESIGYGRIDGTVCGVYYFEDCMQYGGLFVKRGDVIKEVPKTPGMIQSLSSSNRPPYFTLQRPKTAPATLCDKHQPLSDSRAINMQELMGNIKDSIPPVTSPKVATLYDSREPLSHNLAVYKHPLVDVRENSSPHLTPPGVIKPMTTITQLTNGTNNNKMWINTLTSDTYTKITTEEESLNIAKTATFHELTEGYYFTTRWKCVVDKYGSGIPHFSIGEESTEWVAMDHPRTCSYQKQELNNMSYHRYENIMVPIDIPSSADTSTTPPVGYRGITLRQLRAVMANVSRRCNEEGWTGVDGNVLTADTASFYDVDKYVIRPFTVESKESFVTCLPSTAGPQPPRFFISHWWGESLKDLIDCIEQLVRDFGRNFCFKHNRRGGGMTADTPIWIYAYATNPWNLDGSTIEDPKDLEFVKAMRVAEGRTITIIDKDGEVFSRIWCIFELFLTLIDAQQDGAVGQEKNDGIWAFYTAQSHVYKAPFKSLEEERQAVGIISGGAISDNGEINHITARESSFPLGLISKSLGIKVEEANASIDTDRIHILNSIIDSSRSKMNDVPPTTHKKYTAVNDAVRAMFASSVSTLSVASKQSDEVWSSYLVALSKGQKEYSMDFRFGRGAWRGLTADRATQLVAHLPISVGILKIYYADFGMKFMIAIIRRVSKFTNLKDLRLEDSFVGGEDGGQTVGVRLAHTLALNDTIKALHLGNTDLLGPGNVKEWGDALMENTTLTKLSLDGMGAEITNELKERTKKRIPKLDIW